MDIVEQISGQLESALNPITPKPSTPLRLNHIPEEQEQSEIVQICMQLKQSMQSHARPKKTTLRTCYAYLNNQFIGDDLLPIPSTRGSEKDINKQRPRVFYPLTKQQIKRLYSYLKLTIFPDDENYCRIRGNDPASAQFEDGLTEGFMTVLRQMKISEKLGMFLWNLCWAGNAAAVPFIKRRTIWEWEIDEEAQQYKPVQRQMDPEVDVENFNPINFYVDPTTPDSDYAKWSYYSIKKKQEMRDNPLFFNTGKLDAIAKKSVDKNASQNSLSLDYFNSLNTVFQDSEDNLDYDLFYFPYLCTRSTEYRNMIVGIAGGSVLVRFHPNLFSKGINPAVFTVWAQDVDSQYGTGPAEDIKDLQKTINMIANYKLETMARMGNRAVVGPSVDMTNFWGIAGGTMKAENPQQDVMWITGNYAEIGELDNTIGILKAEAQMTASGPDPFQGASQIDFKKTATEIQLLERNAVSDMQEKVEHIGITGIEPLLNRIMHLMADVYTEPIKIRIDDPNIAQKLGAEQDEITGINYFTVNFSLLKRPELSFSVELIGTNPSQSKNAEVESLTQLLQAVSADPSIVFTCAPILKKIGELQGDKNTDNLIQQLQDRVTQMQTQQQQQQQGMPPNGQGQPTVPGAQAGVQPDMQPGMGGTPETVPAS